MTQPTQTKAVATTQPPAKPKALELMASRVNVDPSKMLTTLKSTVFNGASDEELLALVVVANEYGLNPFLKELHAFKGKGGGIVPIVGVDGWSKIINRQPNLDGIDFEMQFGEDELPISCTCSIWIKDRTKPVRVTEYYSECVRKTEPWAQMPRRMLRHKALIQAGRMAFGLSGLHDEDEADDIIARAKDVTPRRASKEESKTDPQPADTTPPPADTLALFLDQNECSFTFFQTVLDKRGLLTDAFSYASVDAIPLNEVTRLMRLRPQLAAAIAEEKEESKR